jgi:eukaryotic-like serine/threonine-protein kinase
MPPDQPRGLCPKCALKGALELGESSSESPFEDVRATLPRSFGEYELREQIARGGMGIVYKGWQKGLKRFVAIKMPVFGSHSNPDLIVRFRGEAVFAASLHHPNIVPIHEVGIHDGQHFIAMDYVDGPSLSVFLRTEPISIREAVVCLCKVVTAIHYAHERNVLHRDLKPSNILLDAEGEPYVTDFGLARCIDGDSTITISGQVLGSPNYMPPEQAAPKRGKVSRRSDVYGLGAILYHCLTGRPPFQAETLEATLHQVLTAEPVSPRILNPSVPLDLETICLKCLEREPSRRYETAQDLAGELTRFLNNCPIHARAITRPEKVVRWCRRNPPLAIAISAAAAFLISGFIVSLWQAGRAGREAEAARLSLYVADMNLAQLALQRNNFASVRERLLAHVPKPGRRDLRGWEWRYLWKSCESEHLVAWRAGQPVYAMASSPGGLGVTAVARRDGEVLVVDLLRQQVITNFSTGMGQPGHKTVAFSPDGLLLAMAKSNALLVTHSNLWIAEELTSKRPGKILNISFMPDSRRVLAASTAGLKAWDAVSGEEIQPPVPFTNECRRLDVSPDGKWLVLSTASNLLAWDLSSNRQVLARTMGAEQIPALALSRSGLLAACDREGWVRVWDLNALQNSADATNSLAEWNTRAGGPNYSTAFSPDGSLLALAGSDQLVRLYGTSDWQERISLKGHQSEIWALAFTHDSTHLISGGKDGLVRLWNPQLRPLTGTLPGTWFPLGFTPDSRQALTLTPPPGRVLQLWNTDTCALEETFKSLTNIAREFVEITPDGRTLVVKALGNVIHVLGREHGESRGVLKLDSTGLESVLPWQCSADSRFVAVETKRRRDGRVYRATELFDLETKERTASIDDLTTLRFSPNGHYLGGKNSEQRPILWDLQRSRRHALAGVSGKMHLMAFSRHGLVAASVDSAIGIWATATGRLLHVLKGHRANVGEVMFSQDDRTLFSTSTDRALKFWNVATGQEVLSVNLAADPFELALSPDDTTLAVGGLEFQQRPVTLWRAPSLKEIDASLERSNE